MGIRRTVVVGADELWSCDCGVHLFLNAHWFKVGEPTLIRCPDCGFTDEVEFVWAQSMYGVSREGEAA